MLSKTPVANDLPINPACVLPAMVLGGAPLFVTTRSSHAAIAPCVDPHGTGVLPGDDHGR